MLPFLSPSLLISLLSLPLLSSTITPSLPLHLSLHFTLVSHIILPTSLYFSPHPASSNLPSLPSPHPPMLPLTFPVTSSPSSHTSSPSLSSLAHPLSRCGVWSTSLRMKCYGTQRWDVAVQRTACSTGKVEKVVVVRDIPCTRSSGLLLVCFILYVVHACK